MSRYLIFQSHVSAFCIAGSIVFGLGSVMYYSLELARHVTYTPKDGGHWPSMVNTIIKQFSFSNSEVSLDQANRKIELK